MPFMVGCSMWHQCTSGQADGSSPYCHLASLAVDICVADEMAGMAGCEAHNALCAAGTKVRLAVRTAELEGSVPACRL